MESKRMGQEMAFWGDILLRIITLTRNFLWKVCFYMKLKLYLRFILVVVLSVSLLNIQTL
jgi:hypothetical protein